MTLDDLRDPAFQHYLEECLGPGEVKPEEQDFDPHSKATAPEDQAAEYQWAQARAILRLYGEWKSLKR